MKASLVAEVLAALFHQAMIGRESLPFYPWTCSHLHRIYHYKFKKLENRFIDAFLGYLFPPFYSSISAANLWSACSVHRIMVLCDSRKGKHKSEMVTTWKCPFITARSYLLRAWSTTQSHRLPGSLLFSQGRPNHYPVKQYRFYLAAMNKRLSTFGPEHVEARFICLFCPSWGLSRGVSSRKARVSTWPSVITSRPCQACRGDSLFVFLQYLMLYLCFEASPNCA